MQYLYYTIYLFYKKVIKIEYWGDTPFFYCNIVLALFESFFIFSLVNIYYLYSYNGNFIDYSEWWFFGVGMILFLFNTYYFKESKNNIIEGISVKSKKRKNLIIFGSTIVFLVLTWLYFHTGTLIRINNGFPN